MEHWFLDAFSRLYKRVCPSVGPSVHPSVHPSVTQKIKPYKSAVFDQSYCQYERERILCRVYGLVFQKKNSVILAKPGCIKVFLAKSIYYHDANCKNTKIKLFSIDHTNIYDMYRYFHPKSYW